ncbi:nischarin isoform X1 [Hydra vulgaris]|nr:nischarin [Hydra vulgaris]
MTSLNDFLPLPGSNNWRKTRSLTTDSNEDSTVVRHVIIREVWLKKHPWPHAVYKVEVMSQTSHWFVFKRYKEFYNLHQKLVALYNVPRNLLPPRILTNNMARETLQQRRELLEHYLQKLLNSCNGAVRKSEEISEFLEVKSNDISNVTYGLACYLKENGDSILMSKDYFRLSPSQLYCITKQLQIPHPNSTIDLGYLYQFVAALSRLNITDPATQFCNGEENESFLTFDLSLFSSLTRLQIDACNINSIRGFESLCQKLKKLTARYCLSSMKSLLIDAAVEKRSTPQVNLLGEIWRVQAAYKLSENRLIVQSWYSLTHINFSHNQITTLDSSMTYLTSLEKLDLSYNLITHLDLQLVTSPSLHTLSLSNNRIYLISASTQPIDKLKNLNLSYNKVQAIGGLLSCQGLVSLNISFNGIVEISEAKKLASLPYLSKLEVAGNHFTKKRHHRLILLAYFHNRKLILDKKSATTKEQAKVDAKFLALENFNDIDDSISTMDDDISTMSNESDSGYEQSIMHSRTQALKSNKHSESSVSSALSSSNNTTFSSNSDMFTQNEVLSRADWDRILNKNMPINDELDDYSTNTRTADDIVNKTELKSKTISVLSKTENSDNTSVCESLKSNRSWVKNLFRKKADHVLPEINQLNITNTNEVFTPEINVVEVDEKYVSRSFDDNCDFEKAEECKEE